VIENHVTGVRSLGRSRSFGYLTTTQQLPFNFTITINHSLTQTCASALFSPRKMPSMSHPDHQHLLLLSILPYTTHPPHHHHSHHTHAASCDMLPCHSALHPIPPAHCVSPMDSMITPSSKTSSHIALKSQLPIEATPELSSPHGPHKYPPSITYPPGLTYHPGPTYSPSLMPQSSISNSLLDIVGLSTNTLNMDSASALEAAPYMPHATPQAETPIGRW
jgi:hypothetical protein